MTSPRDIVVRYVEAVRDGDAAIIRDSSTGLDIIPNVARTAFENSDELMISEPMRSLLAELRRRYRYVIVDLPPLTPVVDVRASASLFDRFILVAEWSKTSMDLLQQSLATSPVVQTRLLGTILSAPCAAHSPRSWPR